MPETDPAASPDLTALTVQLLSAYVANNKLEHGELPGLIQSTRAALAAEQAAPEAEPEPAAEPAYKRPVTIKKSLADPDRIISMIDAKPYRTLTRHLTKHGLTPAEYRARYKLPADYPTIAPGYSEQRRQVARTLGLGRKPATAAPTDSDTAAPAEAEVAARPPQADTASAPARRGSPRRAAVPAARGRKRAKAPAAATSAEPESGGAGEAAPSGRKRRSSARAVGAPPAGGDASPQAKPGTRRGRGGKAGADQ